MIFRFRAGLDFGWWRECRSSEPAGTPAVRGLAGITGESASLRFGVSYVDYF